MKTPRLFLAGAALPAACLAATPAHAVYNVVLPPAETSIEYYLEAVTAADQQLLCPPHRLPPQPIRGGVWSGTR